MHLVLHAPLVLRHDIEGEIGTIKDINDSVLQLYETTNNTAHIVGVLLLQFKSLCTVYAKDYSCTVTHGTMWSSHYSSVATSKTNTPSR